MAQTIMIGLTLGISVYDVNPTWESDLRRNLAAALVGVTEYDIALKISSASVLVEATITTASSHSIALQNHAALQGFNTTALSAVLRVPIEAITPPTLTSAYIWPPALPPMLPSPEPPLRWLEAYAPTLIALFLAVQPIFACVYIACIVLQKQRQRKTMDSSNTRAKQPTTALQELLDRLLPKRSAPIPPIKASVDLIPHHRDDFVMRRLEDTLVTLQADLKHEREQALHAMQGSRAVRSHSPCVEAAIAQPASWPVAEYECVLPAGAAAIYPPPAMDVTWATRPQAVGQEVVGYEEVGYEAMVMDAALGLSGEIKLVDTRRGNKSRGIPRRSQRGMQNRVAKPDRGPSVGALPPKAGRSDVPRPEKLVMQHRMARPDGEGSTRALPPKAGRGDARRPAQRRGTSPPDDFDTVPPVLRAAPIAPRRAPLPSPAECSPLPFLYPTDASLSPSADGMEALLEQLFGDLDIDTVNRLARGRPRTTTSDAQAASQDSLSMFHSSVNGDTSSEDWSKHRQPRPPRHSSGLRNKPAIWQPRKERPHGRKAEQGLNPPVRWHPQPVALNGLAHANDRLDAVTSPTRPLPASQAPSLVQDSTDATSHMRIGRWATPDYGPPPPAAVLRSFSPTGATCAHRCTSSPITTRRVRQIV